MVIDDMLVKVEVLFWGNETRGGKNAFKNVLKMSNSNITAFD